MASSQQQQEEKLAMTVRSPGSSSRVLEARTPLSRSPLNDEAIWVRLREAGFDEESVKRRDKAALIAYIAKLESEVFDYQHHMGLLILEKQDWASKYEQVKASASSAELKCKLDQAANSSALAEAKKREESLKKALGIEKECIANIEKTLHEMRAESAETKIAAESKMADARIKFEDAKKSFIEAEMKQQAAESLQAEASRYHRSAERKLQEVEEREDELRRRLISFKSECDAKEKAISLERQSLCERQKIVQQQQERLLDGQTLLNQREEYIFGRSQQLSMLEKELEAAKEKVEKESSALSKEKMTLDLQLSALETREKAVIEREALLNQKEKELLVEQEKLAIKEHEEVQRLISKHEADLEIRKSKFDADLEEKRRLMENEMDAKRRACELREVDLIQREELVREKEHELEVKLSALAEKEKDTSERLIYVEEKGKQLIAAEKAVEVLTAHVQKEKEEVNKTKLDIERSRALLKNEMKEFQEAQKKLEATKSEKDELLLLEMKLKEEIDSIRAQRVDLEAEAEELKAEKSKFEAEWESMDEKREELRKEAELVTEERKSVSIFLKEERDNLKQEKEALQDQFKNDVESLSREREVFISKMEQEHSEWFSKIQQERSNFVLDIEMQKQELENCIGKRREEIESYLREKEELFELEKKKELQYISSLKEMVAKEQEEVTLAMKRVENERIEIMLDKDRRIKEQAEIKKSIEELQIQREKLKEQRELLRSDREKVIAEIQHLNQLEDLKVASENFVLSEKYQANLKMARRIMPAKQHLDLQTVVKDVQLESLTSKRAQDANSLPSSTPLSWIRRCKELIFKHSPPSGNTRERSLISEFEDAKLLEDKNVHDDNKAVLKQAGSVQGISGMFKQQMSKKYDTQGKFDNIPVRYVTEEQIVTHEVPLTGNKVKSSCTLELESRIDVSESSHQSYPDQVIVSSRKRLNDTSPHDNVDSPSSQRRDHKKRKQHKDASIAPTEEITSNCTAVTLPPAFEDGSTVNQTPGDPERSGNDVDANNKMQDHITRNTCNETCLEQTIEVSLQNSVSEPDHIDFQVRDSGGHEHSPKIDNGVPSHCSEAPTEPECEGKAINDKASQKYGELKPEENGRIDKNDLKMTAE